MKMVYSIINFKMYCYIKQQNSTMQNRGYFCTNLIVLGLGIEPTPPALQGRF